VVTSGGRSPAAAPARRTRRCAARAARCARQPRDGLASAWSRCSLAALVLTYSVFSRYLFKAATDWQDETAVFLLVGATFLCGASCSRSAATSASRPSRRCCRRASIARGDRRRSLTSLFCAFFAWKSWTLLHEAWVDGQTTSSSWAPPLWIPTADGARHDAAALQLLLQTLARILPLRGGERCDEHAALGLLFGAVTLS
jgi:hypothetical protein